MIGNWMIRSDPGAWLPALISAIAKQEYQNPGNGSAKNSNQKNHPNVGQQDSRKGSNDKKQSERLSHMRRGGRKRKLPYVSTESQKHNCSDLPPIPKSPVALPVLL